MSDEDLELLVTLDNPWYAPDEDIFHHAIRTLDQPLADAWLAHEMVRTTFPKVSLDSSRR